MRTLIVDDEAPARARLERLLDEIEGVEVVGGAENGLEAIARIEALAPELVLLDIQMPGLNGFEVLQALADPPLTVFVTAYDAYAIRAFEVSALDYLLKPFSRARLAQAIARARNALDEAGARGARGLDQLAPLIEGLAAQGRYLTRLAVRDRDRIRVFDTHEVDWIGIADEHVVAHIGEAAYRLPRSLSELEAQLDPSTFFRAHRSAIVNLDRVREIIPWFKGSHRLRLSSGTTIELSRARARALRQLLDW